MKKLEIEIPNNKEIDWEASAKQKQIVFKDKQLTYEYICNQLFTSEYWYSDSFGKISHTTHSGNDKYDSFIPKKVAKLSLDEINFFVWDFFVVLEKLNIVSYPGKVAKEWLGTEVSYYYYKKQ